MQTQITILQTPPWPGRLDPVRNPERYDPGKTDLLAWLLSSYAGNKPKGGLWTSTETKGEYSCDWARANATNPAVRMAYPVAPASLHPYRLSPEPTVNVLEIDRLIVAQWFSRRYSLGLVPIPDALRDLAGGALITAEQTDWEAALRDYDGIHLTETGADAVAWMHARNGVQTAFDTWNCESTLWGKWVFAPEPATAPAKA